MTRATSQILSNLTGVTPIAFLQDGKMAYHFLGAGEKSQNPERTEAVRIHQARGAERTWVDRDSKVMNPSVGQVGVLQVSGGMIARIMAPAGPATTAHSGIGTGTFVFQFQAAIGDQL